MEDLTQRLRELVAQACKHPPGSALRQKALTRLIRTLDRQLWREYTPGYEDALQQTWLYFCRNICEATTGERYNPDRASLITWLNNYLKRRLQDLKIDKSEDLRNFISSVKSGKDGELIDLIDSIPAAPDIPPMLQDLRTWAETDADGTLKSTHIKGNPTASCQLLILRRLPPETSWDSISKELGVAIPTLSAFYQRKCMPKLHNFCESEGYV
ncbi:MAG: hypothetical protein RLZZ135_959 [Cyanobacteriota bacterium]|jgi:hypothetical protein